MRIASLEQERVRTQQELRALAGTKHQLLQLQQAYATLQKDLFDVKMEKDEMQLRLQAQLEAMTALKARQSKTVVRT